ncbi:unnamed protein product [Xylocopa violacea]|uniref:Uncharacterized protein n=1 Tax=Xylocopa violacea TaxID=135666 RepID=A0ABP1PGT1_XYLVO
MATNSTAYPKYQLSCFVIKKSDFSTTRNTCVDQFVCCNVPDKSDSDSDVSQLIRVLIISCIRNETREKSSSSVYSSESNEPSSSSNAQDDSICETEESPTCTCAPSLTCYNMVEESDPLVEELLKRLPRTGREHHGYWETMLHCERAAFPRAASNLPLPSREARFYWHLYSTAVKNSRPYQKQVNHALLVTLAKLQRGQRRKKGISVWEQLIRLQTFDRIGRKNIIIRLERLISKQTSLESICLEGLSLTPDEGVRLLLALYNCRKTMRYVYCWRAFEKMVGLAVDADRHVESRFYADKRINKCDWFRAIGCLEFLTILSVNYAYIATPTGDLLVSLAKKLGANWHWLQLLCLKEEIVEKVEYGFIVDKVLIPDKAWRAVHFWAPLLKVQYAIIGIPHYDVHKKFFTRNTPVHTFTLSTGIDLRFRQPWYLDCTIKTLCTWYSDTLVYLCLQVWHNRQNLDNQLKKLFLYLPSLKVFEYIGEIRSLKTLCGMCCQIRSGRCNVCRVHMQLQDVMHSDLDKERWMKSIRCLMACFKCDFDRIGVKFDVDFYCS